MILPQMLLLVQVVVICTVVVIWFISSEITINRDTLFPALLAGLALGLPVAIMIGLRQFRAVRRYSRSPSSADFKLHQRREVRLPQPREDVLARVIEALRLLPHLSVVDADGPTERVVARSWVVRFWKSTGAWTWAMFVVGIVVGNMWFLMGVLAWLIPALSVAERVEIRLEECSDCETLVRISSRPISPFAVADNGVNLSNVERIEHYLRSVG